jgi:hypothetical protein
MAAGFGKTQWGVTAAIDPVRLRPALKQCPCGIEPSRLRGMVERCEVAIIGRTDPDAAVQKCHDTHHISPSGSLVQLGRFG